EADMSSWVSEKRKNDEPGRRFPPWLVLVLVAVFLLGVIATVMFVLLPAGSVDTVSTISEEAIVQTATRVVEQATEMAQGVFFEENPAQAQAGDLEDAALFATATAIIQGATATAQAEP